jgi:hypothetical protein
MRMEVKFDIPFWRVQVKFDTPISFPLKMHWIPLFVLSRGAWASDAQNRPPHNLIVACCSQSVLLPPLPPPAGKRTASSR